MDKVFLNYEAVQNLYLPSMFSYEHGEEVSVQQQAPPPPVNPAFQPQQYTDPNIGGYNQASYNSGFYSMMPNLAPPVGYCYQPYWQPAPQQQPNSRTMASSKAPKAPIKKKPKTESSSKTLPTIKYDPNAMIMIPGSDGKMMSSAAFLPIFGEWLEKKIKKDANDPERASRSYTFECVNANGKRTLYDISKLE